MIKRCTPEHCLNNVDKKSIGYQGDMATASVVSLKVWKDLLRSGGEQKEEPVFLEKEQGRQKDGSWRSWRKTIKPKNLTNGAH